VRENLYLKRFNKGDIVWINFFLYWIIIQLIVIQVYIMVLLSKFLYFKFLQIWFKYEGLSCVNFTCDAIKMDNFCTTLFISYLYLWEKTWQGKKHQQYCTKVFIFHFILHEHPGRNIIQHSWISKPTILQICKYRNWLSQGKNIYLRKT
jgi:hypothetical protein